MQGGFADCLTNQIHCICVEGSRGSVGAQADRGVDKGSPSCSRFQERVRVLGGIAFLARRGQMQGGATQAIWCHRRGALTQQMPPPRSLSEN
jgi:hypothetical protein